MQDVAAKAQVSIGTVSRVLNGKPDVTAELAERVMRTAQALGYGIRHSDPQNSKRVHNIGYIVDSEASFVVEPFQQHFLAGIEQAVTEGSSHIIFSACHNEVLKDSVPAMILENMVTGVILKANQDTPEAWIQKIANLVPLVLIMHRCAEYSLPSVMCDNRGAIYQALKRLKELGHTKIGFFCEEEKAPKHTSIHHIERLEAFKKWVPHLGLEFRPEYIQTPMRDASKGEDLQALSNRAFKNFLALGGDRPTAILNATDIYALTMIHAAEEHGFKLPRDFSIIGIMNTQGCQFSTPPLTSIALNEEEIGRAAVDLLEERIARPLAAVREITVATQLIERSSIGVAPR